MASSIISPTGSVSLESLKSARRLRSSRRTASSGAPCCKAARAKPAEEKLRDAGEAGSGERNVDRERPDQEQASGDNAEDPDCPAPCRGLRIRYGLENYFVPEGEGKALEDYKKFREQERKKKESGGAGAE